MNLSLSLFLSLSIYIYEIGSSYTWCNFTKVTHFLHRKFLKDLTVEKNIIKYHSFPPHYLINNTIFFSLPLLNSFNTYFFSFFFLSVEHNIIFFFFPTVKEHYIILVWAETLVQIYLQEIQMVLDKLRDIISTNLFARNSNDLIMAIPELDFFFC